MSEKTNDIDALLGMLNQAKWEHHHAALTALVAERDGLLRRNAAFAACDGQWAKAFTAVEADRNALVAERDALKQRVAELESHPPADRDSGLRERLDTTLAWMAHVTDMLIRLPHTDHARIELENRLGRAVNAAMRKGEQDAK